MRRVILYVVVPDHIICKEDFENWLADPNEDFVYFFEGFVEEVGWEEAIINRITEKLGKCRDDLEAEETEEEIV